MGSKRRNAARLPALFLWLACLLAVFGSAGTSAYSGCRPPGPTPLGRLPVFEDDLGTARLRPAAEESLRFFERLPADREFSFAGRRFRAEAYRDALARLVRFLRQDVSEDAVRRWVDRHFHVYPAGDGSRSGGVLYTGYYTPVLKGSREPGPACPHPVYGRPDDLVTFTLSDFCDSCPPREAAGRYAGGRIVPYHSRRAIETGGVLAGVARPVVFVADPVELFFLHVQGSGIVCLDDGTRIHLHYAASNGRPYRSIGRYLAESGKIAQKDLSMPAIRDYLRAHPDERDAILARNPRYVFFKKEPGGPRGSLDVEVTPGRSIATDPGVYPPGILALIQSQKPVTGSCGEIVEWRPFSRLVLNQDAGDAIRGPGRVDLFWGGGRYAEMAAGRMKHPGKLFVLLPK